MWMIRSGGGGVYASRFLEEGLAAIGWDDINIDLNTFKSNKDIIAAVKATWPTWSFGKSVATASQLYRFAHVLKIGDPVLTYESQTRQYYMGKITGNYTFNPKADEGFTNVRKVQWDTKPIPRDKLTQSARNTLGSTLTVFKIPDSVRNEFESLQKGKMVEAPAPEEAAATEVAEHEFSFASMDERSRELIKDRIIAFSPYEIQDFIAALLRAMGYKTQVSSRGPDRGKDIVASPDGLGLSTPRIFVEVKHRRNSKMDAPDVRSFVGGRRDGHSCLYVSTGGFTKEARYEAERSNIPLTLMNLDDLVRVTLEHYENMDIESRQMLRLGKIFWPLD